MHACNMSATPKVGTSHNGKDMHYSVGAMIKRGDTYLLIERNTPPFGFAGPAGHIDEGELSEDAVRREVQEETGFQLTNVTLLTADEELDWNWCRRGIEVHSWYLYEGSIEGDVDETNVREVKSIGWYTKEQIKTLTLEPVWKYWFKKYNII
ncbi:MAG: NUDIX hydrolase [Candidatus Magasanikbacteria bacterium GW2011_GWD2_43_18]|nr:MAG: NUDIX hydrolase [Candidatus Magasanikbacteria bacterium GW2011_GWC2_42_27]KKT04138.1 MAG: NUDIX hydrolase [Candidatus Magasanikbacteria bacterium GW2011_GWD2_43_18]KKT25683.1 MAG: NUDIX hydrolase [Candidatus Magasanikbacteria bacterium GW2011_GWA2_43_9]HBB38505.1 hypothetical protein [Candidatus Magasanikbacteria bacterium]HCC13949.1 hypothetical protein [Candidatus Magasanikbacteria bacterium]